MGPEVAACGVLRHQTGSCCRTGAAAACCCRSWAALRRGAERRRDRAEIRSGGGQLFRLVFRAPLSDQPAPLRRDHRRPSCGRRAGDEPAGRGCWRSPREHRASASASRTRRRPPSSSARGGRRRGADHRARAVAPIAPDHGSRARTALHRLLERQHYRARRTGGSPVSDINYRRFFDINELAGLRVEDTGTFRDDARAGGAADRGRTSCRGCGSITSTACSIRMQYMPPPAAADPQRRGGDAARSMSWWRKFSPKASACRRFPASPAPPATNGST